MNKTYINYTWNAFFIFIGAVLAWFTLSASYQLYRYAQLNEEAPAKTIVWSVKEIADDKYILGTQYTFEVDGVLYTGNTRMTSLSFRNSWAAEQAIPKIDNSQWLVSYSKSDPRHSTLQKSFPTKETVSTLLLWALLGYFFWLRNYVIRYEKY
jgi:hypothetical protein